MKPSRDMIAAIRKACPKGEDPDFWMANHLDLVARIRNEKAALLEAIEKAEDDLKKKVAAIRGKIDTLQGRCPHWTSTYFPDPAGGRDSWYECDVCGKDL